MAQKMGLGYVQSVVLYGATFVAIFSIFIGFWHPWHIPHDIQEVLDGLQILEASYRPFPQPQPGPQVVVGFGGCTDVTVNALALFTAFGGSSNAPVTANFLNNESEEEKIVELNSLEDVVDEFTRMFASGAAAERYVKNGTLFTLLVSEAIRGLDKAGKDSLLDSATSGRLSLGGNAPVMAKRLAREGAEVTLVARLASRERKALPPNIRVLSAPSDFGLPEEPLSDIHLVLEYERGSVWRNFTAPRANRYILIRDEENPRLSSLWPNLLSAWQESLASRNVEKGENGLEISVPDLFVFGGLQTMDNAMLSPDIRPTRIMELQRFLSVQLPPTTLVHFEMASFIETAFITNLTKSIFPYVDSIGMNEQELPNLQSLLSYGRVAPHTAVSTPRAAVMLDAMRDIWSILATPSLPHVGPGRRRISRLHLHTLGYQIIMVRRPVDLATARQLEESARQLGRPLKVSEIGRAWPFTRAAAAKASLIAHRHTCATASIDPELTRLLMDDSFAVTADPARWKSTLDDKKSVRRIHFNTTAPVSCWHEAEPRQLDEGDLSVRGSSSPIETRIEVCVAPVPVCKRVTRTVGGGDNISAGALSVQLAGRQHFSIH